jgi:hypothetical protein
MVKAVLDPYLDDLREAGLPADADEGNGTASCGAVVHCRCRHLQKKRAVAPHLICTKSKHSGGGSFNKCIGQTGSALRLLPLATGEELAVLFSSMAQRLDRMPAPDL